MSTPNQLSIEFSTGSTGFYNVLDTDFSNYALVYSCEESNWGLFTVKHEYAWILSRFRSIQSQEAFDSWKGKLAKYTNVNRLQVTDQENC